MQEQTAIAKADDRHADRNRHPGSTDRRIVVHPDIIGHLRQAHMVRRCCAHLAPCLEATPMQSTLAADVPANVAGEARNAPTSWRTTIARACRTSFGSLEQIESRSILGKPGSGRMRRRSVAPS